MTTPTLFHLGALKPAHFSWSTLGRACSGRENGGRSEDSLLTLGQNPIPGSESKHSGRLNDCCHISLRTKGVCTSRD